MQCNSILFISTVLLITVQMTLSKEVNQTKRLEHTNPEATITKPAECSPLEIPTFGKMVCGGWTELKYCIARCLPGYGFEGTEARKIVLECNKGEWKTVNKFPRCIRERGQRRNRKRVLVGRIVDDFYDYDDLVTLYPDHDYMYYYI